MDEADKAGELLAGMRLEEKAVAQPSGLTEDDEAELEEVVDLRSVLFGNVAACYIKLVSSRSLGGLRGYDTGG